MSSNYNGDSTQASAAAPALVQIASSTNATPIVVTTSTNHGYGTGDPVFIEGHLVNTNANGLHTVTVLTSNSYALNGTHGNGVGGATGYGLNYAVRPLWQLISDGDVLNASNLNTAPEAAANATPWLYQRSGAWRVYDTPTKNGGTTFGTLSTTSLNVSTWTALTNLDQLFTGPPVTKYLQNGDKLFMTFRAGHDSSACTSGAALAFGLSLNAGASAVILPSATYTDMSGINNIVIPITLTYTYTHSTATVGGDAYDLGIMGITNGGTHNLTVFGSYSLDVVHLRSNA